ncbi:MAG: type II secretion system protein [Verrucomicrobia bacterium]|nr:type II secretion system protein [Verrucomicrobiota bacterium]
MKLSKQKLEDGSRGGRGAFCALRVTRHPSPATRSGFTLVEMVTVVAVIAILAGIMLGAAGVVQKKAMASRTQATIQQLCAGVDMRYADHETPPPDFRANPYVSGYETVWPCEALWYWLDYYYTSQESSGRSAAKEGYIKFRADQLQDSGKTISGKQENFMRIVDAWGNPINYKSGDGNSYIFQTTRPGESSATRTPRHNRTTYDICSYGANGTTWQEKDKPFDRAKDLNMSGGSSSRPPDFFFKPFDTLGGGSDGHCFGGEDGDDINNWQQR